MRRQRNQRQQAFTLIELMVVLIILGIVLTIVAPNVIGKPEQARRKAAQADIAVIETLLDHFYLDMQRYPTTEEGLDALYHAPQDDAEQWKGPYSKKPVGKDPWGNPYAYACPGTHGQPYDVSSYGKDRAPDGEGDNADVNSWGETEEQPK